MKIKLEQVKASYTADKRADAEKDPWAHYVARPLSFYIAYLFIRTGIVVPVKVVFAGMYIGMIGCGFLISGYYWTMLVGAILININGLLDYVDGDIARSTNSVDEYGGRLDGFNYLLITALLFICIGIGLDDVTLFLVGVGASFIRIFRFAITYQANIPSESGKPNIIIRAGMAVIGAREPLLLICAISGYLDIFLWLYLVINTCELVAVMLKIVRR